MMVALDLAQTVAIFTSASERTINAFELPHNKKYLVVPPPVPRLVPGPSPEARIPSESSSTKGKQKAERDDTPDAEPYTVPNPFLCFRLDVPPKDIGLGWVFGRDAKNCDILLEDCEGSLISKMHFRLDFNWQQSTPLIYNMSKNSIIVSTLGVQPKALAVGEHHPVLENWTNISVEHLSMAAKVPNIGKEKEVAYLRNWQDYRREAQREPPGLTKLQVGSRSETRTPQIVRGPASKGAYIQGNILGQGGFGTVWYAKQTTTGTVYALKRCGAKQGTIKKIFAREIEIYKTLEHDRIVRFVDTFIDQNGDAVLVMDLMRMGNLRNQHKKSPFTVIENHRIVHQVLEALHYLHAKGVSHRDLKPDNILVSARDPALDIKVADFGVSTEIGDEYLRSLTGTPLYCAPEMFTGQYRRKVDIWAAGLMGLQFMKGPPDIPRHPNKQLDHQIWASRIRKSVEENSGAEYDEFVKGLREMLEINPDKRASAERCISMRWFRGGQTEREKLRGPPAIGLLAQQQYPQLEIHPVLQDVGPAMLSNAAVHDLSTSYEEPSNKRLKKA